MRLHTFFGSLLLWAQGVQPLNYVGGAGEMEIYEERYDEFRRPLPSDPSWPRILRPYGSGWWADDSLKPYIEAYVDRNVKRSGYGSYYVHFQRSHADVENRDRSFTISMPGLERSRLEVTYPVRDSIEIRFWIRVADARNVEYRFEVPMKGVSGAWTTQLVATWSGDRDWEEVRYRFYLPDTIIQFLPRLRITARRIGDNEVRVWLDGVRIHAIDPRTGEYRRLPQYPRSNFKLANFNNTRFRLGGVDKNDWIAVLALHDLFREGWWMPLFVGQKPNAELMLYIMTACATVTFTLNGNDTTWGQASLRGGDVYPYNRLVQDYPDCFIRDGNGRLVRSIWHFGGNSYQAEYRVRIDTALPICRQIFYENTRWLYDSAFYGLPTGLYFDNFQHHIFRIPDNSPGYETRTKREQIYRDFALNLRSFMGNIPLMGEIVTDYENQWDVFDYIMWCGFTVACEYGAGQWVPAGTTYDRIKRIVNNPQKKFVLLAAPIGDQQKLYTVAAFYIVSGPNLYVNMHDNSTNVSCHYRCPMYDYYFLNVGEPLARYEVYGYSDTTKGFVCLRRRYQNGWAFLNLDTTRSYTYTTDQVYYDQDGRRYEAGSNIVIGPRSGLILLTERAWLTSLEAGVAEARVCKVWPTYVRSEEGLVYWDCERRGEGPWRWEVWDVQGRLVRQGVWEVSGAPVEIDMRGLLRGMYGVRVNGALVGKVLIER